MTTAPARQYHEARSLRRPDGGSSLIDTGMVTLIRKLWAAGFTTYSSCQDIGESIRGMNPRKEAYWAGSAFLELPPADASRLARSAAMHGIPAHWAEEGAWEMYTPAIVLDDLFLQPPVVQVFFPASQIPFMTGWWA